MPVGIVGPVGLAAGIGALGGFEAGSDIKLDPPGW
jgi:hypothetical protein